MLKHQKFTKYEKRGAYHWRRAYPNGILKQCPRHHSFYDLPIRFLEKSVSLKGSIGVDIGCGDGVLAHKIQEKGGSVIGIEPDLTGLRLAKELLCRRGDDSGMLLQGSGFYLPIKSNALDYVMAIEVIEHLNNLDEFLSEVKRSLRKEGVFICTTPFSNDEEGHAIDIFHEHEFDGVELWEVLGSSFTEVKVFGYCPKQLDWIYYMNSAPRPISKFTRIIFRALATIWNPYSYWASTKPVKGWSQLLAVARP